MNSLCLQAFNLAPKNGSPECDNSHFDRCRHSPGRNIIVFFTTKYAVPRQIKPRILKLRVRRRQSNLSTVFIFVSCEEKDCFRVVSLEQLGLTAARIASKAFVRVKQLIFAPFFSVFESGGITKHSITGPWGNSKFCFPSTSIGSRGNETHCFTWGQSLSAYC